MMHTTFQAEFKEELMFPELYHHWAGSNDTYKMSPIYAGNERRLILLHWRQDFGRPNSIFIVSSIGEEASEIKLHAYMNAEGQTTGEEERCFKHSHWDKYEDGMIGDHPCWAEEEIIV